MSTRALTTSALFIVVAACFSQPAEARRPARRHSISRPVSLDVQPSPEIDARVADEAAKGREIVEHLTSNNLLVSPYVVSAFYYHDGFLDGFPVDRGAAAPERRIVAQISNVLTPERKARFVALLHELWQRPGPVSPQRFAIPVAYSKSGGGHRYAIDLFAAEGAPVHTVAHGVVVLADGAWSPDDLFSTASRKGGNSVIVFDPDHDRFYRYCHMNEVQVAAGQLVETGQLIGTVGHTGLNASQPGHGRHLHFEANEYVGGHVRALDTRRLRAMLRQWRSSPRI